MLSQRISCCNGDTHQKVWRMRLILCDFVTEDCQVKKQFKLQWARYMARSPFAKAFKEMQSEA